MSGCSSAFGRRAFLSSSLGLAAAAMLPTTATASSLTSLLTGERALSFYNTHTGEKVRAAYWVNGEFIADGLAEIERILRDFRTGEVTTIDRSLLDQILRVRTLVGASPKQEIHIISGYRSHKTNEMLRSNGGGVAKKSQHQLGRAIDLRMPGVELSNVRKAALSMQAGGVGYYPQRHNNFVHLDTGRFRTW
jgi:uncharacterized protein YcbK (DUF882 family)